MTRFDRALLMLVFLPPAAMGQTNGSANICHLDQVPVSSQIAEVQGQVSNTSYSSSKYEHSSGSMTFSNRSGKTIEAIEVVIEYFDANGKRLIDLPYVAATRRVQSKFRPIVSTGGSIGTLKHSLKEGESALLSAMSWIVTATCPTSGHIVIVQALFGDGASGTWTAEHWLAGPSLGNYYPQRVEIPAAEVPPNHRLLAQAHIGADGKITRIDIAPSAIQEQLKKSLTSYLARCEFHPALEDGKPVDSELDLLFRFVGSKLAERHLGGTVEASEIPGPLAVVTFVGDLEKGDQWEVVFR